MSQDPHFAREKAKYENPVASREHLLEVLVAAKQALSFMEICVLVDAREDLQQVGIQRRLRAMEREGQIRFTAKKKYEPQAQDEILTGRVIGHRDGFGFFSIDAVFDIIFDPCDIVRYPINLSYRITSAITTG